MVVSWGQGKGGGYSPDAAMVEDIARIAIATIPPPPATMLGFRPNSHHHPATFDVEGDAGDEDVGHQHERRGRDVNVATHFYSSLAEAAPGK